MTVEDKLIAISTELAKHTIIDFFPPASIIINAIESERNRVRQENMKQMIDKAIDELGELKDLLYKEMNAKENQMIHQIMQNVGDEFEFDKRDAYAYVLVNVMKKEYDRKIIDDVIFQLQNLSTYDLLEFKKLYEEDLQKEKQLAGKTYLDLVMMQGMSFEAAREFLLSQGLSLSDKVGNQFSIKSNFDFIRLSRTTLNKLEYVGVVNIPKFVENATRRNDYFPSLTHESQYLYEIALTPPE